MTQRIAFLVCPGTMPGSPTRRDDADEHDLQVAALRGALAERGFELVEIDWRADAEAFEGVELALLGTVWDYADHHADFLASIEALEARGIAVCNPPDVVRWNSQKTYLLDLAERGVPTIPTLWIDGPSGGELIEAFETLGTGKLVAKRQIGAGAEGQHLIERGTFEPEHWRSEHPMMVQGFLPAIQSEGEYSFVFVDGALSHTLIKKASGGDYRIQSLYGGYEETVEPSSGDRASAEAVMAALPFDTPLYARIDMVRGPDENLLLMEAELIEPYLYPLQGPDLGPRMAHAIAALLDA